jgi:FkbM family methyltransferase
VIIHYAERDISLPDDPDITGWFEDEAEVRAEHWQVKPGETVADIGCHIGGYTVPALVAGATVYAIDPSTVYTGTLTSICQANQLDLSRLHVVNEAVAAPGGYVPEFRQALDAAPYPEHHAAASAWYTTLDELAQRFTWEHLDWVKIDTEGAELGILQGGEAVLRKYRPALLIEDHTDVYSFVAAMGSRQHCTELLEELGYGVQLVRYEGHLTPDRVFMVAKGRK